MLLAEDEDNDVFMMRRALRKLNDPVFLQVVKDGEDAIQYLAGQNQYADRTLYPLPVLILLDIKMPRKSGFDVLRWIQADGTLAHIPSVTISSSKMQNDVDLALQLGASDYRVKPMTLEEWQQLLVKASLLAPVLE